MKKIIAIILILIMCVAVFVGCESETNTDVTTSRFVVIDKNVSIETTDDGLLYNAEFIVDRETGVVYLYTSGYRRATMTTLLNKDGKPMIYDFSKCKIINSDDANE